MAVVVVAPFAPRGPAYAAHSISEQSIVGAGLLEFVVQANLAYTPGMRVRVTPTASDAWMEGIVKSYAGLSLTVEIHISNGGGGPYKEWNINLAGEPGIVPPYAGSVTNSFLVESHAANEVTFKLVTLVGSAPTDVNIIPALFTNGVLRLIVDDSVSVVIPVTCKLGTVDQTAFRLWLLLVDDGGTLRLGVIQTRESVTNSIQAFPPDGVIPGSMFVAGISNQSGKVYTGQAVISDPRPYIVIGFADYDTGLTTAGQWNVSPNRIVMFGPGIKLPADELQTCGYQDGSYGGFGVGLVIPMDNTIPQSSEGAPVLNQAITPRCAMSVLEIEAQVMYNMIDSARKITAALFRSGVSNAFAAIWNERPRDQLYLWSKAFAGNTLARTYIVNIGLDVSGSFEKNGPTYGGVANTYLYITERQT